MKTLIDNENKEKHIDIIINDNNKQQRIAKVVLKNHTLKIQKTEAYKNVNFDKYFEVLKINPKNATEHDLYLLYDGMMEGEFIFSTDVHDNKECIFNNDNNVKKMLIRNKLKMLFKKMEEATSLTEKEYYLDLIDKELNKNVKS